MRFEHKSSACQHKLAILLGLLLMGIGAWWFWTVTRNLLRLPDLGGHFEFLIIDFFGVVIFLVGLGACGFGVIALREVQPNHDLRESLSKEAGCTFLVIATSVLFLIMTLVTLVFVWSL